MTAGAVVALGAIIVTGAAVRLSGSGLGCPTWPNCEDGSLVPRGATGAHGWIEFLNRSFTGAVSVAVAVAVLGALWRVPYRPDLLRWALGLVAGVMAQAVLGGIVVLVEVAPLAVMGHYLLSAVLVANAVLLHHHAGREPGATRAAATPALRRTSGAMVGAAVAVLAAGTVVTGAGPHGGDEAADRLDVAVSSAARIHGLAAWVLVALVLATLRLVRRGDADPAVEGRGRVLLAAMAAQGVIGYVQYLNDVPELLVGAHVAGSVIVWAAALWFHLGLRAPVEPTATGGSPPVAAIGARVEGLEGVR